MTAVRPSALQVKDRAPEQKSSRARRTNRHKSLTQRSNPAVHPSYAPGFLPPTVTAGAPKTAIPLDTVACPSVSPDDRPVSPPVIRCRPSMSAAAQLATGRLPLAATRHPRDGAATP